MPIFGVFLFISFMLALVFSLFVYVGRGIYVKLLIKHLTWLIAIIATILFFNPNFLLFFIGIGYIFMLLSVGLKYFQPENH